MTIEQTAADRPRDDCFIGVVTVLFKSDDVLEGFVTSLAAARGALRLRLYGIDNSPTATGTDLASRLCKRVGIESSLIFNNHNAGVAAGNNQGLELALADGCSHVLFANNDIEFPADALVVLVDALRRTGELVAAPKIHYWGRPVIWYGGGGFDWKARTQHFGFGEPDCGQCDAEVVTRYAPTCFMLVDAEVFARVGTMDERYFCYYDDSDFAWRLGEAGIAILYCPTSVVEHKVSSSTGGDMSPFSVYYMNRNRVYFARKHFKGLHRAVALTTIWASLVRKTVRLGPTASGLMRRMWRGAFDGWRLPLGGNRTGTRRSLSH